MLAALSATGSFARPVDSHFARKTHHSQSICARAYIARTKVIQRHGKRAPGRNICRYGVVAKKGARQANIKERWRYLLELQHLIAPAPAYLSRAAGPPRQPPAGTLSSSYSPTGLAACIVSRESGGNPRATNGQYHGIAQWSPTIWARDGGLRYAGDPVNATYQQQLQVLSYGLALHGGGDWRPYDGC